VTGVLFFFSQRRIADTRLSDGSLHGFDGLLQLPRGCLFLRQDIFFFDFVLGVSFNCNSTLVDFLCNPLQRADQIILLLQ
jgi:hypothetical protein